MRCLTLLLLLVLSRLPGLAEPSDLVTRIAALVSGDARLAIREAWQARQDLGKLPQPGRFATSPQIGFHSVAFAEAEAPLSLQVDLGHAYPIKAVALVPVGMDSTQNPDEGYGFPLRFKVEAALEADFSYRSLVKDHSTDDFPNPGNCPVVLPGDQEIIARYVRVTVTGHWPKADRWVTALGELIVLSDGRNVARGRPVTLATGEGVHFPPTWRTENLTDGHSIVGPPVTVGGSPSNGYLSANAASVDERKWLQLDLGGSVRPSEIRLIPARPSDVADHPGIGFPVRFQIQAGYGADFLDYRVLLDQTGADFPNPGENSVSIPGGDQYFRFLRIVVNKLWEQGETRVFALSEIEALEQGRSTAVTNLALGATVTVSDFYQGPRNDRWAPEYVTDGFSSRHPLTNWEQHLLALDRRRLTKISLTEWTERRDQTIDRVMGVTVLFGGGVSVLLLGTLVGVRWRHRRLATRTAHRIRQQIAGDLHDEVGSNLGSIVLLAQSGEGRVSEPEMCGEKFREISVTAQATAESMRDIVWLLKAGNSNTLELRRQMGAAARLISEGVELVLTETGNEPVRALPLDFTRNVYLMFKEALVNARRHSGARLLSVQIRIGPAELGFVVGDDGTGFDPQADSVGNGLGNLRDRAGSIGGELALKSEPGQGTRIELRVKIPKA